MAMSETAGTFLLRNAEHGAHVMKTTAWPAAKHLLADGHELVMEFRLAEDAKTDKQRKFYHGYILKTIANKAEVNGQKFDLKTWKEHFRSEFLGHKTVTTKNPMTGKKVRRRVRVSTEDLGVKGYSQLIDRVAAFAATELGVEFFDTWVDPETGEIYQLADMRQHKPARRQRDEVAA